jgi:membrane protein implicated in regulation of membrane protease activity
MQLTWWNWVVLGIVGIAVVAFPALSFPWQVLLWVGCSVAFIGLWFKVFKPGFHKTRVGISKGAAIGEVGIVTREIRPYDKGEVRFQRPLVGDDVWESIADEEIKVGERVKVLDIEGDFLKVGRT